MTTSVRTPEAGTADSTAGSSAAHARQHSGAPAADWSSRRPVGEWIALAVLLLGTGALYLWQLSDSGWANSYYSAAVQAGTQDWKAMLFGSLDSANFITVDKTPASLWLMELSSRIFGFSSTSVLVPQALCGVGSVALLYAAVRRWAGPVGALLAGAVFALTPVAALMFRFNNPDALLVLLMVAAAYAVTRALDKGATGWLLLAGGLVGFGYLTKMMQAFLVVPAFGLVYLVCAPVSFWKRVWQLLLALAAMIVGAGWWVALVELWPASSRPYIGGSQNNSILELTFGYNGLSRLTGNSGGGPGGRGGGGGAMFGGPAGLLRMFNSQMGAQVSWLIPAALIALVAGLWLTFRARRTDPARAGILLWGVWLLANGLTFSLMAGIVHEYYTVALAPALGALVGGVGVLLWRRRDLFARIALAAMVAVTGWWGVVLLGRVPDWQSWLPPVVIGLSVVAVLLLLIPVRRLAMPAAVIAVLAGLAAPTAYTLQTVATPHSGSTPSAGPASARGGFGGGMRGGQPGGGLPGMPGGTRPGGTPPGGTRPGGTVPGGAQAGGGQPGGKGPAFGGEGNTNSELATLLKQTNTVWAAAVSGAQTAGPLELATGKAVMGMGGWSGDPAPTLAQFQQWVSQGKIAYFVGGGQGDGGGPGGRGGDSSQVTAWVQEHFTATTVGGQTVYDLRTQAG
jgi:4-amino-4-deoxy-L-arabinose transferase-like glycosyltransferase